MIKKLEKSKRDKNAVYDQEWINLVVEAKQSGLTIDEVRSFLQKDDARRSMRLSLTKEDLQHI